MAGTFRKRGNGTYSLTYHVGYDANGKRIRKYKTVKARNDTEAKKRLAAFITEVETGEYVAPSHTRFGDYVRMWKKHAKKNLAPKTIEMYNYLLDGRIIPAFSHLKIEDVSHVFIDDYLKDLKAEGLSSSTLQKHYNILNGVFKLACKHEMIKKNPMDKVDKPSVISKPGQVYDSEELKRLHQLLNQEENRQQALMIKLALFTGMRKGEMLALQWDDVDFATNTIHINHSLSYTKANGHQLKEPKTKGSVRKVAPPQKFMDELRKHKLQKSTDRMEAQELWEGGIHFFMFSSDTGKPLHPNAPSKWWSRFIDRTNIKLEKQNEQPLKKIRFHDLRHTAATDLINKGANLHSISKRLGHANITTTMNIYGHYLEEADQKIADILNEDYI